MIVADGVSSYGSANHLAPSAAAGMSTPEDGDPKVACYDMSIKQKTSFEYCVLAQQDNARSGCKGIFNEGGEVIKLHIEGSLTIPITRIK